MRQLERRLLHCSQWKTGKALLTLVSPPPPPSSLRGMLVLLLLVLCVCFHVACVMYLHLTSVQVGHPRLTLQLFSAQKLASSA